MTALPSGRLQIHLDFGAGATSILIGECLWYGAQQVAAFEWSQQALELPYKLSPIHMPIILTKGR